MKNPSTETHYPIIDQDNPQAPQNVFIQIACISFFPLLYFVGKALTTFLG
jgi:hypothetical protein